MTRSRVVMQCTSCRAPVVHSLRRCPYCGAAVRLDALGPGVREHAPGQVVIDGAHVVVGAERGEVRACPFCGASTPAAEKRCSHCQARLVIETLYLRKLVIERGGSMTIHQGGKVIIGRPDPVPRLAAAAKANDLDALRARIDQGDELDGCDEKTLETPLLLAIEAGALDAARLLIALGANVADAAADGRTPLHAAAQRRLEGLVDALLAEGADVKAKTKAKQTAASMARAAGHTALAQRLEGGVAR